MFTSCAAFFDNVIGVLINWGTETAVRAFAAGGLFRWPDGREGCFAFPHIHTKNFAGADKQNMKRM